MAVTRKKTNRKTDLVHVSALEAHSKKKTHFDWESC